MLLKGKQEEQESANFFISLWEEEKQLQVFQRNSTATEKRTAGRDCSIFEGGSWTQLYLGLSERYQPSPSWHSCTCL